MSERTELQGRQQQNRRRSGQYDLGILAEGTAEELAALTCRRCGDLATTELVALGPGWRRLRCGSCDAEWTD